MEYVYAGLLLHYAKKDITEENMEKIFQATGINYDINRVRMFVAAFKEINIDEVLKQAAPVAVSAAAPAAPAKVEAEAKKEEKKEEEKKEEVSEETISAGLSALFG
ncbi:MAG: 50S ribosomal protein P1 [Thermoproteota archaeon]|jgi:large subunit ribosomal protein L12|nr:50S ribosomal protein P1 [Thermoproteota archaeon]